MKKLIYAIGLVLLIIVGSALLLLVTATDRCEIVKITNISNGRVTIDNGYSLTIQSTRKDLQVGDTVMFFSRRSLIPILNRFVVGNSVMVPTANITQESIEMACGVWKAHVAQ